MIIFVHLGILLIIGLFIMINHDKSLHYVGAKILVKFLTPGEPWIQD